MGIRQRPAGEDALSEISLQCQRLLSHTFDRSIVTFLSWIYSGSIPVCAQYSVAKGLMWGLRHPGAAQYRIHLHELL